MRIEPNLKSSKRTTHLFRNYTPPPYGHHSASEAGKSHWREADSLMGAGVSLDRLDRLLHKRCYQKFCCCFVAAVDPFRVVVCRHVPAVAGSLLETESVHPQASIFPLGTLVPLPTVWHFNGAGIGFPQRSCKAEARYVAKALH